MIVKMIGVFLDRDGTIGGDGGGVHPSEFTLYDFSVEAIKRLNDKGIKVYLFTNQSWIGIGKFSEQTFIEGTDKLIEVLKEKNAFLDGIYYCPHTPEENCECRKPQPTLLQQAQKEHNLDLTKCYIVGDRWSDMASAANVGSKRILVKTGRGLKSLQEQSNKLIAIDHVADNVSDAVKWILADLNR